MRSLLLVRHPPPLVEPGLPVDRWGLGAQGLQDALAISDLLPPFTSAMLSSTAPVAAQTARAIAGVADQDIAVLLDDRLDEVVVANPDWVEDTEAVEHYLVRGAVDGWESPSSAISRFSAALLGARRRDVRASVVLTHGVVLSLWLAPRLGRRPHDVWRELAMPDLWRYDPAANTVVRVQVPWHTGSTSARQAAR